MNSACLFLRLLAYLVFANDTVARLVMARPTTGHPALVDVVVRYMDRNQPSEAQLMASRVLIYLYRCGHVAEKDPRIIYKALPCVIR